MERAQDSRTAYSKRVGTFGQLAGPLAILETLIPNRLKPSLATGKHPQLEGGSTPHRLAQLLLRLRGTRTSLKIEE